MVLGDFLEVYDKSEPFYINYPDDAGWYDADYYESVAMYRNRRSNYFWQGLELPYWDMDEVENITRDGDGIITIELKYVED